MDRYMDRATAECCNRAAPSRRHILPTASMFLRLLSLHRQRRALAKLNTAQLSDIGVTAQEAHLESRRAIWDTPGHWRVRGD